MTLKLSDSSQGYQALQPDTLHRLLNIKEIYYEPAVNDYTRGQEILLQYPDAKLIEVAFHLSATWNDTLLNRASSRSQSHRPSMLGL